MSALQRQTYANPDDALFVKTSGNSVIQGNLEADYITADSALQLNDNSNPKNTIFKVAAASNGVTGNPIIQVPSGSALRLGLFGNAGANSVFTPAAFPSASDTLVIGGKVTAAELGLGNQSSGTASIAVGQTNVIVPSQRVNAASKIFLSFYGSPSAGPGAGPSQGNLIVNQALIVNNTSFRVDHTDETGVSTAVSNVPVTFSWLVIN